MEWLRRQFEISRAVLGNNVRPMEGMRGLAVLLVFLVHYCTLVEPWLSKKHRIFDFEIGIHAIGNAGVDLFFVLSGYLIYGTLIARQQAFVPFIVRRIRRIYPAFLVVFAIYLLLSLKFPAEIKIPKDEPVIYLIENLLLLPGIFPIEPMITVAWSLSYEMLYYLVIPMIVFGLNLRNRSVEWRVMLVCVAVITMTIYCSKFGGHIRLIMFMAGILLYESVTSRKVRTPKGSAGGMALVVGLLAMILPSSGNAKIAFLFIGFYIFCLHCFLLPIGRLAKALSWTPLRWLGNMSYSYYLLHGLTLKAAFMILSKLMPASGSGVAIFFALMPAMFALTLIPATVLFIVIERPLSLRATLHQRQIGHIQGDVSQKHIT